MVGRSASPAKRGRIPDRTRVLMTAVVLTPEGAQKVRIQDLSAKGARVLTDGPVAAGRDAMFKRGELFAAGHIVWADHGRAGISFYRELSEAELERAFNPAQPPPAPGESGRPAEQSFPRLRLAP